MGRFRGATGSALWELLNCSDSVEHFKRKWETFKKKASFPELVAVYGDVQKLAEADLEAEGNGMVRVVLLPAPMTREQWIKANCNQDYDGRADA